jgi:hypothetical protein
LNPKANKLLKNLEELNLIAIHKPADDGFMAIVKKLKAKAKGNPPTLDEITNEVELVRAERYARSAK